MRLILHSSYLTLEYLLWRKSNLNDVAIDKIRIRIANETNRNLGMVVYAQNEPIYRLKQYGALASGTFIENEYIVLKFLKSSDVYFVPEILFFDKDNLILATKYLDQFYVLNEEIEVYDWGKIIEVVKRISIIIKNLHELKTDGKEGEGLKLKKYAPTQILRVNYTEKSTRYYKDLAYLYKNWNASSLIHFDLNLKNILLKGDDVKIIDWELAMIGDPVWDVALLIVALCKKLGDDIFFIDKEPARFDEVKKVINIFFENYEVDKVKLKVYLRLITHHYDKKNRKTIKRILE